ncbi:GORK, partial [Symbiodinium pilosum]
FIGFCVTMLIASNMLHLGQIEGSMQDFATGLGSVMMGMVAVSMFGLVVMTASGVIFRSALGGQQELLVFNLQRVPVPADMAKNLMSVSSELAQMREETVVASLRAMAVYDVKLMMAFLSLLGTEVLEDRKSANLKSRISSSSFGPGAELPSQPEVSTGQDNPEEEEAPESAEAYEAEVEASPEEEDIPDDNEDAVRGTEMKMRTLLEEEPVHSERI